MDNSSSGNDNQGQLRNPGGARSSQDNVPATHWRGNDTLVVSQGNQTDNATPTAALSAARIPWNAASNPATTSPTNNRKRDASNSTAPENLSRSKKNKGDSSNHASTVSSRTSSISNSAGGISKADSNRVSELSECAKLTEEQVKGLALGILVIGGFYHYYGRCQDLQEFVHGKSSREISYAIRELKEKAYGKDENWTELFLSEMHLVVSCNVPFNRPNAKSSQWWFPEQVYHLRLCYSVLFSEGHCVDDIWKSVSVMMNYEKDRKQIASKQGAMQEKKGEIDLDRVLTTEEQLRFFVAQQKHGRFRYSVISKEAFDGELPPIYLSQFDYFCDKYPDHEHIRSAKSRLLEEESNGSSIVTPNTESIGNDVSPSSSSSTAVARSASTLRPVVSSASSSSSTSTRSVSQDAYAAPVSVVRAETRFIVRVTVPGLIGLCYRNSESGEANVVTQVFKKSLAARAGIQVGDILCHHGEKARPFTKKEVKSYFSRPRPIEFSVLRLLPLPQEANRS